MAAVGQTPSPRRATPLVVVALGALACAAIAVVDPTQLPTAALLFLGVCAIALLDVHRSVFTWANALALLVIVIWLIPIKIYELPVELPFDLEVYRLLVAIFALVFMITVFAGKGRLDAGSQGAPLALFVATAVATQFVNLDAINESGSSTQAIKQLSYLLSFVLVFVLMLSTVKRREDINRIVIVTVLGAVVVAVAALYEAQTKYNLFQHLHEWLPGLEQEQARGTIERGGRFRARGSAQHPIALGAALIMVAPLGLYLASRAASKARALLWVLAAVVIGAGAFSSISRTVVLMLGAMVVFAVAVWGGRSVRFLPLLLVLPIVLHFTAPGSIATLVDYFQLEEFKAQQSARPGLTGSGRLTDVGPAIELWKEAPILGHGLGTQPVTGAQAPLVASQSPELPGDTSISRRGIIFDDQYLGLLVELGIVGLIAVVWLVWGTMFKLGAAARRVAGSDSALIAACGAGCAGYTAALLAFDALAFVQVTLLFFIIAALGLRARQLATQAPSAAH